MIDVGVNSIAFYFNQVLTKKIKKRPLLKKRSMLRRLAIIPSGGANWEVFYRPEKIFVIEVLLVFK